MIERTAHAEFRLADLDELRAAIKQLDLRLAVDEDISCLARPVSVAGRHVPNSMAIQPMEGCDATPEGAPDDLTFRRYRRLGAGGAGLLWFEATAVVPEGRANPRQLWLHKGVKKVFAKLLRDALKAATASVGTSHRPFTVLQLTHSGRYSRPGKAPAPIIACHDPYLDPTRWIPPNQPAISDDELEALEDAFVEAARAAYEVGFDAVDIKSCHRYLINELLAARTREGRYGGGYENRTRFLKNVIGKIQAATGRDKIVACRLGIHDAHPHPYGWGMDPENPDEPNLSEPQRLIRELQEMGVAIISVTMGNPYYKPHVTRPFDRPAEGEHLPEEHPLVAVERLVDFARQVREGVRDLVVVGSGYSWLRNLWPHIAAAEINSGAIQLVGVGRQAFACPGFAKEIMETGKLDRRHTCIACSSCTQIMRDGGRTGCVPFDQNVYGSIYRDGRRSSFEYVQAQASRCRDCFDPRCKDGCPAGVDIPGFVRALADGEVKRSYEILRERNALPELCGRVCPVEVQCQGHCIENAFSQSPVPVGDLQVYVSRVAREQGWDSLPADLPSTGKRVAVIGAGPAGLACAAELVRRGHSIEMFDARENPGGLPASAIPESRLPDDALVEEVEAIFADAWGDRVKFHGGEALSDDRSLDTFTAKFDAVFLAVGLGAAPSLAEVRPSGAEDALTFLERCKLGRATVPKRVAVLGGGNTAVDAAVQATRCGAQDVYLIYRRSLEQMSAWPAGRDEALGLGVHFLLLTQPLGYELNEQGHVRGVRIARTTLGDPLRCDESGRRRPVLIPKSGAVLKVELALEALGQELAPGFERLIPGVELTGDRLVKIDDDGRTSRPGVYAGGDMVNGGTTVVQAIADGMRAAEAIHGDLTGAG